MSVVLSVVLLSGYPFALLPLALLDIPERRRGADLLPLSHIHRWSQVLRFLSVGLVQRLTIISYGKMR